MSLASTEFTAVYIALRNSLQLSHSLGVIPERLYFLLQCRQKTVETKHKCTKCTVQYCLKCLNNRYGAEEEKKVSCLAQNAVQLHILMLVQMSWRPLALLRPWP